MGNSSYRVVIFRKDKYPCYISDFKKALEAGEVKELQVDETTYAAFYNIQNSVAAVEELTGVEVHLGVMAQDMFVDIFEMDSAMSDRSWYYDDAREGFIAGLEYRQNEGSAG